jgi:hypothetical protein
LAGANIGASALAPRDRNGAAGFNRSAATILGTAAALAAEGGAAAIENLWDGPFGALEIFSASDFPPDSTLMVDGVSTSGLRLFPTTGFAQSAVLAAAILAKRNSDELESLEISLPAGALSWIDGSRGGFWWDVKAAVSASWFSKDPTSLAPTFAHVNHIKVTASQLPAGGASIAVKTGACFDIETISTAPGVDFKDPRAVEWMNTKWDAMVGDQLLELRDISKALVGGINTPELWHRVRNLLDN